jgi:RHS repeat-associated protein
LSDGTRAYAHDALGRLASTTQGGATTTYGYTGDGHLALRTAGGATTRYTLDAAGGLVERLGTTTGGTTTWYARGWGQELSREQAGTVTWLVGDRLGSVRAEYNNSGTLTANVNYDPFGTPQGGSQPSDFGFTGEPHEAGGGLVHLRARWYAPGSGRFVSRDPFAGAPSSPATLHPYMYAHNDPATLTDPTGMCVESADNWCREDEGVDDVPWDSGAGGDDSQSHENLDAFFLVFKPGKLGNDPWCDPLGPDEENSLDPKLVEDFLSKVPLDVLMPPTEECNQTVWDLLDFSSPIDLSDPSSAARELARKFSFHSRPCDQFRYVAKPVLRPNPLLGGAGLVKIHLAVVGDSGQQGAPTPKSPGRVQSAVERFMRSAGRIAKVAYEVSDRVVEHAIMKRERTPNSNGNPRTGGNVAMIVYRAADGTRRVLIGISKDGVAHAEELLIRGLRRRNIPRESIEYLYSELRPCDSCFAKINSNLPGVPIKYSFELENVSALGRAVFDILTKRGHWPGS